MKKLHIEIDPETKAEMEEALSDPSLSKSSEENLKELFQEISCALSEDCTDTLNGTN